MYKLHYHHLHNIKRKLLAKPKLAIKIKNLAWQLFALPHPSFILGRCRFTDIFDVFLQSKNHYCHVKAQAKELNQQYLTMKSMLSPVSTILFSPRTECFRGEENNDLPEYML